MAVLVQYLTDSHKPVYFLIAALKLLWSQEKETTDLLGKLFVVKYPMLLTLKMLLKNVFNKYWNETGIDGTPFPEIYESA